MDSLAYCVADFENGILRRLYAPAARRTMQDIFAILLSWGVSMYVYLLRSLSHPGERYIGLTTDLKQRLAEHNSGKSPHTSKYAPWEIVVAVYFHDHDKARSFEQYLKQGSGHAFANRHFW